MLYAAVVFTVIIGMCWIAPLMVVLAAGLSWDVRRG